MSSREIQFMRLNKDSPLRHKLPLISVDIDYQKSIPIEEIASRLGMDFKRGKSCFCPDPNCPDNASKNRGAHVNANKNTIHCFVCGNTWNPFTLVGLKQFGYEGNECFTHEGIVTIGQFIADDLGFGGTKELKPQGTGQRYPKMPNVTFHKDRNRDKTTTIPLWRAVGLTRNPFASTVIPASEEKGIKSAENVSIPVSDAALMLSMKGIETLKEIDDYMSLPALEISDSMIFIGDIQKEQEVIEDYTNKLHPLLDTDAKKTLTSELLYQFVMSDNTKFRESLYRAFPDEVKEIIENLSCLYPDFSLETLSFEDKKEEMEGGDDYDVER